MTSLTPQQQQTIDERLAELKAEAEARGIALPAAKPIEVPKQAKGMTQQALDYIAGLTLTSAQAPMFNTLDEAVGKINPKYGQNVRDMVDEFQTDHPVSSFVGQAGASAAAAYAASLLPFVPPQAKAGLVKQALKGVPLGGALGFLGGMGAGEGDISSRVETGLDFAGPGMIMGGIAPAAGAGLNKLAQGVAGTLGLNKPAEAITSYVDKYGVQPLKKGARKAFEFLGADDVDARALAERKLNKTLAADAGNPADMDSMIQQLEDALNTKKKPITVAEVFPGDETKQLAETVGNMPGPQQGQAKKFFNERQRGKETYGKGVEGSSGARILEDLKGQLAQGRDFDKTAEDIIQARRAAAGPKYAGLADVEITPDAELVGLIDRLPKEAFSYGSQIAKLDGNKPLAKKLTDIAAKLEAGEDPGSLSMQELDYLKQGMDDVVNGAFKDGKRGLGGKSKEARDAFRDHLDSLHPEYKSIREEYAGKSQMLDALQMGRDIFSKDFDDKAYASLTASEKEMTRIGAFQAFSDYVKNAGRGRNIGAATLDKPQVVERFSNLFDDEAGFESFLAGLKKEQEMTSFGQQVTGNSATARRMAGKEALEQDSTEMAAQAADIITNPSALNLFKKGISYAANASKGINRWVASEIGDMSFKELDQATIKRLQDRIVKDKQMTASQKAKALGYLNATTSQQSAGGE